MQRFLYGIVPLSYRIIIQDSEHNLNLKYWRVLTLIQSIQEMLQILSIQSLRHPIPENR